MGRRQASGALESIVAPARAAPVAAAPLFLVPPTVVSPTVVSPTVVSPTVVSLPLALLALAAAAVLAPAALAQSGTRSDMRYCFDPAQEYVYVASPRCQKGDHEISYQEYRGWTGGGQDHGDENYGGGGSSSAAGGGSGAAAGPVKGGGGSPAPGLQSDVVTGGPHEPAKLPSVGKTPGPPKQPAGGYQEPTVEAGIPWAPETREPTGSGTGFYVDTRGHVLTNAHVVEECSQVGILQEEEIAPTEVLLIDPEADLAVLSAAPTGGPYAVFRSTEVEIGEPAFAVGFPLLGVLTSINMTSGIISSLTGPEGFDGVIQTTAAIQPGNSGGPLVDEGGSVIGIVVATGDPTTTQNLGWAIRSDVAVRFLGRAGIGVAQQSELRPISGREVARGVGAYTVPLLCFE